jgi:hypothetical protein
MGFTVSWINPGRLIRIRAEAPLTPDDFAEFRQRVQKALAETPEKLDYIFDLSSAPPLKAPEQALRTLLDKHGVLRNTKTGRLFITGANEDQQLLFSSVALALRLEILFFEAETDALKYVAELAP